MALSQRESQDKGRSFARGVEQYVSYTAYMACALLHQLMSPVVYFGFRFLEFLVPGSDHVLIP